MFYQQLRQKHGYVDMYHTVIVLFSWSKCLEYINRKQLLLSDGQWSMVNGTFNKRKHVCLLNVSSKETEVNGSIVINMISTHIILALLWFWFDFWYFNSTFSNISTISWRPVLVVEEAGVPGENHRPWASNW